MSNKLALVVNFIGIDKMSGALRNIVGLGRNGSQSLRALNGEARQIKREMRDAGKSIKDATGNVTDLIEKERALARALEDVNRQIDRQKRMDEISAKTALITRRGEELKTRGRDNVVGGAMMATPFIFATKQAMTFESAMADVRKVVDFETPRQFDQMGRDILTLSTKIPMAAEGIASIVAAAGRAGIARSELLAFAQDSAKLGIAFDINADQAGEMMAKWRTAFGLSQKGVVALSDQINALTNTSGGKADAVAGIVTRIGALGKVAGVTAPQLAAMGQLLNKVGVEEEVAATGIKNLMLGMTKGQAATKGQKAALKSLGLDATDLAKRMQTDASGAITDLLSRLGKLPKAVQAGTLTELFGSESIAAIAPLLTNLDQLRKNLALVGDSSSYAGSMEAEYQARIATTEGATGLALNALKALNIEMGKNLLPTVTAASKWIVEVTSGMRAWAQENPGVASTINMIVVAGAGLSVLRIGVGALQFAFGGLLGPLASGFRLWKQYKELGSVAAMFPRAARMVSILRIAFLALGRGVMQAGLMMMANPIVLAIVVIVAAIGGAAYLIYTHWDKIKAAFAAGVSWVSDKLTTFGNWMKGIGSAMMQGLLMALNPALLVNRLLSIAKAGISAFKNFFGIKSPSRLFMEMGGHMTGGLALGIDAGARAPQRSMNRMMTGLSPDAPQLAAPAPAIRSFPGGGARGGAGFAAAAAPAGDTIIHVYGAKGQDVEELARIVMRKIEDAKGTKSRRTYEGDR